MKKFYIFLVVVLMSNMSFGQVKVRSNGGMIIDAHIDNWDSGLLTKVYNPSACAYHLNYNGENKFFVCAQGYAWAIGNYYLGSDVNFKENIKTIENPLSKLRLIRGVEYNLKEKYSEDNETRRHLGVIAQEVEPILPYVVKTMHDETKAVAYMEFVGLLIEGIKELDKKVSVLENKVNELKNIVNHCCENSNIQEKSLKNSNIQQSYLEQNQPNPFNEITEIKYYVPPTSENAFIYVFNLQGTLKLQKQIYRKSEGSVTILGTELEAGMYIYSLIINGKEIDTKKMLLTK